MEWLSHSQKKYCELCKTSFRFTKLYSPHMPKKLPTRVFLQKAIMHVVSHVLVWIRGLLVGSVWLVCLPWLMRYSWRIMFWFGDAGWARDSGMELIVDLLGPSRNNSATPTLDTAFNHTISPLPAFLNITSQTLNMTRGEPLLFRFVKAVVRSMYEPLRRSEMLTEATTNATVDPLVLRMAQQKQSSILSEVEFLKHLSPSATFNRLVIDILEGQIITLSVVVACILVFLIREWVLQQQPVADIAVGDADNALAQAGGGAQDQGQEEANDDLALPDLDNEIEIQAGEEDENGSQDLSADLAGPIPNENTLLATITGEDVATSQNVQDIKRIIEKTEILLDDCSPEVRQKLREQHPFLHNLEELKQRVDHFDQKITSLPNLLHEPTEETAGQDAADMALQTLLVSAVNDLKDSASRLESHAESSKTPNLAPDEETEQFQNRKTRSSRFRSYVKTDASMGASDETVQARPQMPTREHSFLATDIARNMEEQSIDDETSTKIPTEDEQRSQDSSESWQQISVSEQQPSTSVSTDGDHTGAVYRARGDKGKGRAGSPSSELRQKESPRAETLHALSSAAADVPFGPFDSRDDLSWISTAGSNESQAGNDQADMFGTETRDGHEMAESASAHPTRNVTSHEEDSLPRDAVPESTPHQQGPTGQDETLLERAMNWFWGDIVAPERHLVEGLLVEVEDDDDEHVVNDIADEAPFVPFAQAQPVAGQIQDAAGANPVANADNAERAFQIDLNDPDAIEDAEDLEGILELIGMQGPILGLFQNALFSSVLILISVVACVWLPYIYGKLVLLSLSMPELLVKIPLRLGASIADVVIDLCLTIGGYITFGVALLYRTGMSFFYIDVTTRWAYQAIALPAQRVGYAASERLAGGLSTTTELKSKDFLYLSMVCHAGLHSIEESLSTGAGAFIKSIVAMFRGISSITPQSLPQLISGLPAVFIYSEIAQLESIKDSFITLWNTGLLSITIGEPIATPNDPMLAYWNARDRALAVVAGYGSVAFCSACYLKIAPITTSPKYRQIEGHIIDFCQQAGGVLKVILIISIEMIAFPLFCGFLLDFALMPLFESATFASRVSFTLASPWTAGFVHWFVGTCYMFHFALFVSMCRKIMRTGVLYFIRDPDDPTFHPVRDVLERNVITQLRKIAFSAIVYGALIVVCLGGVVWGMWYASANILPIHWTSSESALEFPLDILFYNFLTPIVVRFARPSDGLHAMYKWWFRRCARILRLSDFLFKDPHKDEQGHFVYRTWKSWLTRQTVDVEATVDTEPEGDNKDVYFKKDGRHVQAPASDQVRIPKGLPVFVDVDENGHPRGDGQNGQAMQTNGINPSMTAIVYIPPWFRIRIALFVIAVWFFAAFTGIMVTIVPLLCGRKILSTAIPNANNVNDIYAFSLGIYVLGSILWTVLHYQPIFAFLRTTLWPSSETRAQVFSKVISYTKQFLSIVYVYSALALGLPILFAVLLELYILMPIHVFFGPEESHVIHVIQDWTLGILYVRIGTRFLTWNRQSRAARAVQAVVRNGYLNPAAGLATRAFIVPSLIAFAVLIGFPNIVAAMLNWTVFRLRSEEELIRLQRLSYPVAMACVFSVWLFIVTTKATERWRARIRDEVYLIGERLHNFGEKRPGPATR
jgi:E3 ubiquitin-protein ligase MARCH6